MRLWRNISKFINAFRFLESTSVRGDASPCYGPFTTQNGDPKKRYPQDRFFSTPLQRLEFSVQSTNNVFLDLKDGSNNLIVIGESQCWFTGNFILRIGWTEKNRKEKRRNKVVSVILLFVTIWILRQLNRSMVFFFQIKWQNLSQLI